jgi:hypothetical protein
MENLRTSTSIVSFTMLRKNVNSSMARSIGYDEKNQTLEIEFTSGEVWQYYEVPESVYVALTINKSVGKFFHAHIRGKFKDKRVH